MEAARQAPFLAGSFLALIATEYFLNGGWTILISFYLVSAVGLSGYFIRGTRRGELAQDSRKRLAGFAWWLLVAVASPALVVCVSIAVQRIADAAIPGTEAGTISGGSGAGLLLSMFVAFVATARE